MKKQKLAVLGATGSIGASTLDVAFRHPDRFEVFALTGHRRLDVLAEQCRRFKPCFAVVGSNADAEKLAAMLDGGTEVLSGPEALCRVASLPEVDTVMAAIVGAAGLPPAMAAVSAGKRVLLANKEALVMAGSVFMNEVKRTGAILLPIDSEHNAVFQSMPRDFDGDFSRHGVQRILLTASGGPFRNTPLDELAAVTPDQACAHPNWSMGRKISVDSATMMNKGLEVIEARWLFNATPDQIEVVIHPQSVIHSLVAYTDGSVLAQLGNPDMRTPIAHAMAWPERIDAGVAPLDLFQIGQFTFERPDLERFPCLALAYSALRAAGNAPAVLNAANEIAVEAFLEGRLRFDRIPAVIAATLDAVAQGPADDLAAILAADTAARAAAQAIVSRS